MSIQSEITRISGNVSDSLDAVSAKGVTVPSGSNSDDLAGLIAQIPSSSVIISDTLDSHGGTIRTITTGQTLNLQPKTVTPTSSQQIITPDTGYNGLSQVTVNAVSGGYIAQDANGHIVLPPTGDIPTLITKTITQNGTYAASSDSASGYSSVTVNVSGNIDLGWTNASTNAVSTLTFGDIYGEPQSFSLLHGSELNLTYDGNKYVIAVQYDGVQKIGAVLDYSSLKIRYVPPADANEGYSFVYWGNNNTLTITTNNYSGTGLFPSGNWYLMYTY